MNCQTTTPRTLSTEQAAAAFHVCAQTMRAALCRNGHYLGVKPIKLPNRLLAWPYDAIERIISDGDAQ